RSGFSLDPGAYDPGIAAEAVSAFRGRNGAVPTGECPMLRPTNVPRLGAVDGGPAAAEALLMESADPAPSAPGRAGIRPARRCGPARRWRRCRHGPPGCPPGAA